MPNAENTVNPPGVVLMRLNLLFELLAVHSPMLLHCGLLGYFGVTQCVLFGQSLVVHPSVCVQK